ncbi:MAG: hypothetical protein HOJ21_01500 [Alphaproteobacteria bacterium]|nr:hypothetical protein [Alphaproteobacteria bacterium]
MAASGADSVAGIAASLSSLADKHGSDKGFGAGLRHGYTRAYASALAGYRDKPLKLLEIGLSIARDGVYCPSLAMWSDWLPGAEIYGLDIHDFSAFQHDRCQTFQVDQTDPAALQAFAAEHGPFDVIIDDGAHLSDAQQISFFALWPTLKPGGFYFIEDLHFQPPTEPADAVKTKVLFHGWRGGLSPQAIWRLARRHRFQPAHVAGCLAEIAAVQFFDSQSPDRNAFLMADALLAVQKAG